MNDGLWKVWRTLTRMYTTRQPQRLRDFEADARQQRELFGPLNRRSIGVRPVEVHRIVGTVGRSGDFDANFHPLGTTRAVEARFERDLRAMRSGEVLPPIELYKLRRVYYVLDGHHRVGAARMLGIEMLEADVTVFVPSGDPEAVRLFSERLAFERATGLNSIGGSRPATYRRLLAEIHDYRRQMADEQAAPVELQTAAMQWYARVFLPALAALRGSQIQQHFSVLRHADMLACLWEEQRLAHDRVLAVLFEEFDESHEIAAIDVPDGTTSAVAE